MIIHGHILVLVTLVMTMINAISLKQGGPPHTIRNISYHDLAMLCICDQETLIHWWPMRKKTDLSHNINHSKVSAGRWCWCYLMVMRPSRCHLCRNHHNRCHFIMATTLILRIIMEIVIVAIRQWYYYNDNYYYNGENYCIDPNLTLLGYSVGQVCDKIQSV